MIHFLLPAAVNTPTTTVAQAIVVVVPEAEVAVYNISSSPTYSPVGLHISNGTG